MAGTLHIAVGSDHAGFPLKETIVRSLRERGHVISDYGTDHSDPVDYPDYGAPVAEAVSEARADCGILICGTGIGMSIVANRFPGIRAALCHDPATARASRRHNDANILVLGGRVLEEKTALEITAQWLGTGFEGGRHARRILKIEEIGKRAVRG